MMEFLTIAGAVFVGYIFATIALCALMLNTFVQKMICKYTYNMTMKLYEKLEDEPMFNGKIEA